MHEDTTLKDTYAQLYAKDCHESLVFLLDHGSISVEDMKLNVETFLWKDKLEYELERCQQTIDKTRKELQAALMVIMSLIYMMPN